MKDGKTIQPHLARRPSAAALFADLQGERTMYIQEGARCASFTIPSLFQEVPYC